MLGPGKVASPIEVLVVTLLATLVAACFTMYLVDMQVQPVREAARTGCTCNRTLQSLPFLLPKAPS